MNRDQMDLSGWRCHRIDQRWSHSRRCDMTHSADLSKALVRLAKVYVRCAPLIHIPKRLSRVKAREYRHWFEYIWMHFLLRCTQFVRHTSAEQYFFHFSHQQTVAKQQRQQRMVAMISQYSDHVEETEEKRDGRREMRKWKNTKTKFICTTKITKMDSRVFVFIQSQREREFHKLTQP